MAGTQLTSAARVGWRAGVSFCRARPLTVGVIVIGVALVALFVPAVRNTLGPSCEEKVAVGYPELEAEVARVLDGVQYTVSPGTSCADMMSPRTYLTATVHQWGTRGLANQQFREHDWRIDSAVAWSPDGRYSANIMTATAREYSPEPYIDVMFTELADWSDE